MAAMMTPPAPETVGAEVVHLICKGAAQTTILKPSVSRIHPTLGWVLEEKAFVVKADRHRATMPADWLPYLRVHGAYTGTGQPKSVWIEGEEMPEFEMESGPLVREGAQTSHTPRRQLAEPVPGWRTASSGTVRSWVKDGRVRNVTAALEYEIAHGKRKMVIKTLADRLTGLADEELPEEAAELAEPAEDELAPVYAAPLPPDAKGV